MSKRLKIIIAGLIILFFIFYSVRGCINRNEKIDRLKKNYVLVQDANVTEFTNIRFLVTVYYSFTYRGKIYSGERSLAGVNHSNEAPFLNRTYPVIVDTTDPSNNAILITPHHFDKMMWQYPDSLKWVLKYYTGASGSW